MSPSPAAAAPLCSIADWRGAVQAGADVPALLRQRRQALAQAATPSVWISLVSDGALEQRLAELQRWRGDAPAGEVLARWPLWGVPFAAKDNIDAAGFDTTAACPAWRRPAEHDAQVVARLLAAGAVLMGKTNLDQFATGLVGTRSPFGAPRSAVAPGHVSGGSSSGSAVAVAQGEVAFSLGTDTAGSGRVPAAFNQIVGLKPTPGRVSTRGVLPACRSVDCVSVFALTVAEAAAVLAVIEGDDPLDEFSRFQPGLAALPARLRVGVPAQVVADAAQGVLAAFEAAVQRCSALGQAAGLQGVEIVPLDFEPLHAVARLLYEGPWVAERFVVLRELLARDPEAMDPTVAGIVRRGADHSAADTFTAMYALQRGRRQAQALWQQVDVLMVPSAPRHPTPQEVAAEPVAANAVLGTYTNFVNLLGWSALAVPAGHAAGGLPFGITFIGPADADAALARLGQAWEAALSLPAGRVGYRPAAGEASAPWPEPAVQPALRLAVVGAHLSGLPLNAQLTDRGAVLEQRTTTAPCYRLFELPGTQPRKPGLVRVADGGAAIAVEVWRVPMPQVGSFLAGIPAPLGLGTLSLADGSAVHGFLCEGAALAGARDITAFGGWRAWLEASAASPAPSLAGHPAVTPALSPGPPPGAPP